jgi:hypothetical protein
MPYKNDLLKVNDESKLKCNEMRKLNEWIKSLFFKLLMWSFKLECPTWDLFHSPSKKIKWVLLEICVYDWF